jgi:hypothetical protein
MYFKPLELFNVHLVYFVVIWYIFPRFGILYQEKSGNPGTQTIGQDIFYFFFRNITTSQSIFVRNQILISSAWVVDTCRGPRRCAKRILGSRQPCVFADSSCPRPPPKKKMFRAPRKLFSDDLSSSTRRRATIPPPHPLIFFPPEFFFFPSRLQISPVWGEVEVLRCWWDRMKSDVRVSN